MKKILSSLLILAMLLVLPVTALAAFPPVYDAYGCLSSSEQNDLLERSLSLREAYGLDIVICIADSLDGISARQYADDWYDSHNFGENGVLFLVAMAESEWHISTSGTAIQSLNDRALTEIEEEVIPYFSQGRFYDGFCRFLDLIPDCMDGSIPGNAVQHRESPFSRVNWLLSVGIGAALSGIALLIMRSTMNTKRPQRSAGNYETDGSYHLRQHQDLFLYSNLSKRPRPQNNTSSGSSVHRASSGRSHGGRGGKF